MHGINLTRRLPHRSSFLSNKDLAGMCSQFGISALPPPLSMSWIVFMELAASEGLSKKVRFATPLNSEESAPACSYSPSVGLVCLCD